MRAFSEHAAFDLEDVKGEGLKEVFTKKCEIHTEHPLYYRCLTHNTTCCSVCSHKGKEHDGCNLVPLEEMDKRETLEKVRTKCETFKKETYGVRAQFDSEANRVGRFDIEINNLMDTIREKCEKIRRIIDIKEQEILKELEGIKTKYSHNDMLSDLDTKLNEAETVLSQWDRIEASLSNNEICYTANMLCKIENTIKSFNDFMEDFHKRQDEVVQVCITGGDDFKPIEKCMGEIVVKKDYSTRTEGNKRHSRKDHNRHKTMHKYRPK